MNSYCIKTNNKQIIKYLLNKIEELDFPDIIYCNKSFEKYENVIMHYKNANIDKFKNIVISLASDTIIEFYEDNIIKKMISVNYFYFDEYERKAIYENCEEFLLQSREEIYETLFKELKNYVKEKRNIYLEGIVNFRISEYIRLLDNIVDMGVNKYIIEKEYKEFINLLKIYVNSAECKTDTLHLIYSNGESILLDKEKNIINLEKNSINNVKYLSDISFSSNDIALNTLLSMLPKRIEIHIIDKEDEFINTLKLIFEAKVKICTDCNICRTYRNLKLPSMKLK